MTRPDARPAALTQAARMAAVQPPVIPIVGRWIRETPGTISLGQGIVSYPPPAAVIEAVRGFGDSLEDHRYGPVEGLPALVARVERKLREENGIEVARGSRVVVTAGGNMGFLNAVLAVADPGDEIVLQAPFYFNHDMAIVMAGCRTVVAPTRSDYQLDPDAIAAAITPRTRAVVTVSPNNPTGAVYDEASLRAVNALCRARGVYHVHDEAYEYFTYGVRHVSPGRFEDAAAHTISLFSLSKAYGLAGWRVGYMVIPEALFEAVNKIQDTNLICPPAVSQAAALAALDEGRAFCEPYVRQLADVRARVYERLTAIADLVEVPEARGAFYVLLRIRKPVDPFALCERLVREHRVAVIPGTAFGVTTEPALRVSYGALAPETVAEGIDRLVTGLRALLGN
ncbi:MAG TPA: pyridoxal phosphate-dependent aminotransferase [Vicinamibacterales bacterium]